MELRPPCSRGIGAGCLAPFVLIVTLTLMSSVSNALPGRPGSCAIRDPASDQRNIRLLSQIGGTLNDVVIQGDYVYLAIGPRVVVLDVSDPAHPAVVGRTDALRGNVSAIAIQNSYAYVTAGNALYIFSITVLTCPLRVILTQSGVFEFVAYDGPAFHAMDVAVEGDHAYVIFARGTIFEGESYLKVIDISTPDAPTEVGELYRRHLAQAVAAAGDYVYVAFWGALTAIDVSNPEFPSEVGSCSEVDSGQDLVVVGNYAYVANWAVDEFRIVNVGDPANPQQVGSYHTRGTAYGLAVAYPYAYVTDTEGGLRILDIADPSNPTEVGFYDLSDDPHGEHLAAFDVAVAGDTAYVVIDRNSLHIVDITYHANPSKIASYESPVADPTSVRVVGSYAYVTDYNRGLYILNVANPSDPQVVGLWDKNDPWMWPIDVDVAGDYAYVLDDSELHIIDVSNPASPFEVGSYEDPSGGFTHIAVAGNYAYVTAEWKGLLVFDVSNPAVPTLVTSSPYNFDGHPFGLSRPTVLGTSLYTTCGYDFCVVNVADPANPELVSCKDIPGYAQDAVVASYPFSDFYAYVAESPISQGYQYQYGGLRILSLTDLSEVGYYPTPRSPYSDRAPALVAVAGYEAYMVEEEWSERTMWEWEYTLRLVDLHDLSNPTGAGFFELPGRVDNLAVAGSYAYVPVRDSGLMVFRYVPSISASIPPSGGNLASNFDNTSYTFAAGTFTHTTTVTHAYLLAEDTPSTGNLVGIQHAYQVSAVDDVTGQPVEPNLPYTITIQYTDAEKGPAIEETLALYRWDGLQWVEEPTSRVDTVNNTVTAAPNRFSTWAVLGETHRVFLPMVLKDCSP